MQLTVVIFRERMVSMTVCNFFSNRKPYFDVCVEVIHASGLAPVAATAHIFCSFYAIDLPDAIYAVYFCRDLQLISVKRPFTPFIIKIGIFFLLKVFFFASFHFMISWLHMSNKSFTNCCLSSFF